jgi:hypothetical protein
MTYSETRDREQLRHLEVDIAKFILRYQSRPPGIVRRTLFLLPGGLGSQLLRARTAYQANGLQDQTFEYDMVWLTDKTFAGEALDLNMHEVNSVYQDLEDRIIIPDGPVEWQFFKPYTRFIKWCELNNIDWFVFGWDWRRHLEDAVDFFINKFLPLFKNMVGPKCGDVLQDYVLIGHSGGGMVLTLMLQQDSALLRTMGKAITVASPFYGYDAQIHRWFEGIEYFNHLGKDKVIEVITSMPGLYVLPYLDLETFQENQAALADDPHYPLTAYPSHDFANGALKVDPFDPGPNRYPQNTGFSMNELARGLTTARRVAKGPSAQYLNRFFNIRGIETPTDTTPGSLSWELLAGPENPSTSPIRQGPVAPGDDTQPAWSSRLATLPAHQVITVEGVNHLPMMEFDVTQQAIGKVLGGEFRPLPTPPPVEPAMRAEAREFVRGLQRHRRQGVQPVDEEAIRNFVNRQSLGSLQSISARIMMDLLKAPTSESE